VDDIATTSKVFLQQLCFVPSDHLQGWVRADARVSVRELRVLSGDRATTAAELESVHVGLPA